MEYNWPAKPPLDPGAITAIEKVPEKHALLAEWPEDEKIRDADQPEAIARILIPEFHKELANAKVAYLFVQSMGSRQRTSAANTSALSKKVTHLSGYDFCITYNWTIWRGMSIAQRAALVDHELEHCGVDDDGRFIYLTHDLQEFNVIVRRWGLWHPSVTNFVEAAKAQLELPIG